MFCPLTPTEYDQGQAVHLHHAHETRRRLEPDSVQLVGLHEEGLRNQLHRDAQVGAREAAAGLIAVRLECKSTPTAESGEFTSQTGCTPKTNYRQSSNFSCQSLRTVTQLEVRENKTIINSDIYRGKQNVLFLNNNS